MGLCCSKDSVSVSNGKKPKQENAVPQSAHPYLPNRVAFDVVVPESSNMQSIPNLAGSVSPIASKSKNRPALLEQSMYSMREMNTSILDPQGRRSSAGCIENMSFTNAVTEVTDSVVDQFVNLISETIASIEKNGTNNMLEGALAGGKSQNAADVLTQYQQSYLEDVKSHKERVDRFIELEEMSRQEIFAAWRINMMMLILAAQRTVPTIRIRRDRDAHNTNNSNTVPQAENSPSERKSSLSNPKNSKKNVMVIHSKDIDFPLDEPISPIDAVSRRSEIFLSHALDASGRFSAVGDTSLCHTQKLDGSLSPAPNTATKVEHYELLALTCREISFTSNVHATVITDTWDFLSTSNAQHILNSGAVMFRFFCSNLTQANTDTLDLIDTLINHSSFADELKENNTPKINAYDKEANSSYVTIMVKAMYMLPGIKINQITPELIASTDYQKSCQPGDVKFDDSESTDTFRMVKTIIKFVFKLTVQFKVAEISDPDILFSFKDIDGMVPAKCIMLERTKRNSHKVDSTVKVRSFLFYYPVNEGVLCTSQTIVINNSLPKVASMVLNTFGSQGASESADTAKLTRQYLIRRFGDSRGM